MGKPADIELQVLSNCVKELSRLDGDATTRVMEYLSQRFFGLIEHPIDSILRVAADSPATDKGGRFEVIANRHIDQMLLPKRFDKPQQ